MSTTFISRLVSLILMLVHPTVQVDIAMTRAFIVPHRMEVVCEDIAPGVCCVSPWQEIFGTINREAGVVSLDGAGAVEFRNLHATDIAVVWGRRSYTSGFWPFRREWEITACSGTVLDARPGPGDWLKNLTNPEYPNPNYAIAHGASYISLPRIVPPAGEVGNWLAAEGVLGLVWGGGNWFASQAASAYLQKHLRKRDIRSADKGQVYSSPPPGVQYPAIMYINGTQYTAQVVGGVLYRNDDTGVVVNITSFGI